MVGLAAPAVGPAPASRDASSFVIFSISVVHCPAAAIPRARPPKHKLRAAMWWYSWRFSRLLAKPRVRISAFDMNQDSSERSARVCPPIRPTRGHQNGAAAARRGCCERDPNISALPVEGRGYRCGSGPQWDDNAPPQAGIVAAIIFLVHVGGEIGLQDQPAEALAD